MAKVFRLLNKVHWKLTRCLMIIPSACIAIDRVSACHLLFNDAILDSPSTE